ncbi:hypothetical protein A3K86_18405 [Photobacterium jeanii]|uniref:VirK protein n=1 Tax=Photobacterium jeanii TaxID=858640 RepID=A0A178K1H5_9GAMM|nr:VirK/YbjX family protein [Photobacterium jeanii]OAN10956.1 hypothetical protein A3K86_18405 [Photobacterium jeanii]PST90471.1 DUF535 domain-containing protein [Photobacterium jeanii]
MHSTPTYLSSLPKLANKIHPNSKGVNKIRKNARFCLLGLVYRHSLKTIINTFNTEALKPVLDKNPDIIEKPLKPYLCVNWSSRERAQHLCEHYQFIEQTFGLNAEKVTSYQGLTLLEFEDREQAKYRVNLYCGASREGGLGLKLINEDAKEVYSLSFNISGSDKRVLHIGMLQGPASQIADRNEVIKTLTRSLHGLRTKALMVELVLMLAKIWQIDEVKGVSNKGHIYQALRYVGSKRNSVTFDYDDLWAEYNGTKTNKFLFSIPTAPERKDPSTLNKNKRRLYTKRYQWLDETELAIRQNLAAYTHH